MSRRLEVHDPLTRGLAMISEQYDVLVVGGGGAVLRPFSLDRVEPRAARERTNRALHASRRRSLPISRGRAPPSPGRTASALAAVSRWRPRATAWAGTGAARLHMRRARVH